MGTKCSRVSTANVNTERTTAHQKTWNNFVTGLSGCTSQTLRVAIASCSRGFSPLRFRSIWSFWRCETSFFFCRSSCSVRVTRPKRIKTNLPQVQSRKSKRPRRSNNPRWKRRPRLLSRRHRHRVCPSDLGAARCRLFSSGMGISRK